MIRPSLIISANLLRDTQAWRMSCSSASRSGNEQQARKTLGNRQYPPLDPAPGTYVYE